MFWLWDSQSIRKWLCKWAAWKQSLAKMWFLVDPELPNIQPWRYTLSVLWPWVFQKFPSLASWHVAGMLFQYYGLRFVCLKFPNLASLRHALAILWPGDSQTIPNLPSWMYNLTTLQLWVSFFFPTWLLRGILWQYYGFGFSTSFPTWHLGSML